MTQEDKDLLLKYLCMALPYEVIIEYNNDSCVEIREMGLGSLHDFMVDNAEIKPYLRPMSSMKDEELSEYRATCRYHNIKGTVFYEDTYKSLDWLNKKHFDYRGLIEIDLAIEVTKENNPYKE